MKRRRKKKKLTMRLSCTLETIQKVITVHEVSSTSVALHLPCFLADGPAPGVSIGADNGRPISGVRLPTKGLSNISLSDGGNGKDWLIKAIEPWTAVIGEGAIALNFFFLDGEAFKVVAALGGFEDMPRLNKSWLIVTLRSLLGRILLKWPSTFSQWLISACFFPLGG